MAPPVDIHETREGLVVVADVPGVAQEALEVRVDENVLTIRGHARHAVPGDVIYREHELVNFFRQFERFCRKFSFGTHLGYDLPPR